MAAGRLKGLCQQKILEQSEVESPVGSRSQIWIQLAAYLQNRCLTALSSENRRSLESVK